MKIITLFTSQDYLQDTIDKININMKFYKNSKTCIIQNHLALKLPPPPKKKKKKKLWMPAVAMFILQSKECSILL